MKTFAAYALDIAFIGGFNACVEWADEYCIQNRDAVVKILKIRPKEEARVCGEVTLDGFRSIADRRPINLKRVIRASQNGSF